MLLSQATAVSSGAVTLGLDRVSGCGAVRSGPGSPGAGSEADDHLYWVCQPKLSWPVRSWRMIMSLSLFDLSDYPGNRGSYWKGIIQGSAGEKQSNNNPGPQPPWSRSSYSWRWANLFWSLPTVASIYKVCVYYLWTASSGRCCVFFQASGGEGPFGFPRWMSSRSECEAFMEMVFLNIPVSWLCGVILLRFEIRMLFRTLLYLPPLRNLYVIS